MRYLIFSIGVLFFLIDSNPVCSQEGKQVKVVLKNGLKIKGAIIKSFDEDRLEIDLLGADPIQIKYDHIKKINFNNYGRLDEGISDKIATPPGLQTKSYFHEIRGSVLFGEENVGAAIHTINGYQFNQYLGAGLGLGVNKYGNYLAMPIYANVKGYILDQQITPFYFGDIGYGFAWNTDKNEEVFELDNVTGGLYWQLGLGYQFNFYSNSLVLTLGYINQHSKADYVYYRPWDIDDVEISEKRILRRLNFSIGFLF